MKTRLVACLWGALVLGSPALAQQDDAPIAYPDEEAPKSRPRMRPPAEAPPPERRPSGFQSLARADDPNVGLAFEALGGLMLLSSARGQVFDLLPALGGRLTWEYGRLIPEDPWHEALWLDVRYTYTFWSEGTQLVRTDGRLHYATLAPAYEFKLGEGSPLGIFLQAGGGVAFQQSVLRVDQASTEVWGLKPVVQYGVGLRGRPQLSESSPVSLAFRLEVVGFRRDYLNDFLVSGSLGLAF